MLRIILSVLFVQAIAANLATNPAAASTSPVINSEQQRNKKAIRASQSPITYVQHLVEPDSKIIRPKWNKVKKADKKKANTMSNHELLTMLGLAKLPSPSNHHRKRLATQSRHVGRPDDSRVFIVKLPPNPYYYSHSTSHKSTVNEPNSIHDDKSKKIPVGFKSNGKPAAIYHWNLPVLSKIISGSNGRSNSKRYKEKKANLRHNDLDVADLIDIQNIPTWSDSSPSMWHENDTNDKSSASVLNGLSPAGIHDDERAKVLKKKSTPNFYAPVKKQKTHKYFPSNGKPKSFYVMKNANQEKSFHNLID